MATYFHTTRVYITITEHTADLTLTESSTKSLVIWKYILKRHSLDAARNTTFEDTSSKVNEYFVSENTLYRCVNGFNIISNSDNLTIWDTIFSLNKTSIFYLESI